MSTLLVAILAFAGFIVAYNTYGRWLSRKIFRLDADAQVPSKELQDDVDYCPSRKSLVFGHHFTSIAGTGPIVGPAIAVFWGWLPALLWVVFGSIFIGAVHDFGALVVSLRNRGQTVGEIAGRMIAPRAKLLFLFVLFFALTIVLAIFGLVIAAIFSIYPESVLPVWVSLPLAIIVGLLVRKNPALLLPTSLVALGIVYVCVYLGAYHFPIKLNVENPVIVWTLILLVYCGVASVLPVWLLLQPRDYINSQQLIVALILLVAGLLAASVLLGNRADLVSTAPAIQTTVPTDAPPIFPFLFITIACGAISGFHCLVSSGTSSKQISNEKDAKSIGYGAMLLEGALAVIVILACCAGTGMGKFTRQAATDGSAAAVYTPITDSLTKEPISGSRAWKAHYNPYQSWAQFSLGKKVGAFVEGGANFLTALGIPLALAIGVIAVLVACFAATTLDTATRLQRYVIQEIGNTLNLKPLSNMYIATLVAVVLGGAIAMLPGPGEGAKMGSGGLHLWPLFGATNQLLAGLALMVTTFYLWRRKKPIWFVAIPMVAMVCLPFFALGWQLFNADTGWFTGQKKNPLLGIVAAVTLGLQIWMIVEALMVWTSARGKLEDPLPPLAKNKSIADGRSC